MSLPFGKELYGFFKIHLKLFSIAACLRVGQVGGGGKYMIEPSP